MVSVPAPSSMRAAPSRRSPAPRLPPGRPRRAASPMRRAAIISGVLHVAALLALIVVIPTPPPPAPPPDDAMEMEFDGTAAAAQKSQNQGHVAAPADSDTPATDNPALEAPTKQPIETAPPPPPPPPPPPTPQQVVTTTLSTEKLIPSPPTPDAIALKPPPPMKVAAAEPPPKPVQVQTPLKQKVLDPQKTKPLDSVRHQPNEAKQATPDTHSLLNTLDKLLADQKQTAPPTHRYNPQRGGAHDAGGQLHGGLTGSLTEGQRKTIGDSVRRCYSEDTAAKDYASFYVEMTVTVDQTGEARLAELTPAYQARANASPQFRALAERAVRAVLSPQCAHLPVPANLLNQPSNTLKFGFRP